MSASGSGALGNEDGLGSEEALLAARGATGLLLQGLAVVVVVGLVELQAVLVHVVLGRTMTPLPVRC